MAVFTVMVLVLVAVPIVTVVMLVLVAVPIVTVVMLVLVAVPIVTVMMLVLVGRSHRGLAALLSIGQRRYEEESRVTGRRSWGSANIMRLKLRASIVDRHCQATSCMRRGLKRMRISDRMACP